MCEISCSASGSSRRRRPRAVINCSSFLFFMATITIMMRGVISDVQQMSNFECFNERVTKNIDIEITLASPIPHSKQRVVLVNVSGCYFEAGFTLSVGSIVMTEEDQVGIIAFQNVTFGGSHAIFQGSDRVTFVGGLLHISFQDTQFSGPGRCALFSGLILNGTLEFIGQNVFECEAQFEQGIVRQLDSRSRIRFSPLMKGSSSPPAILATKASSALPVGANELEWDQTSFEKEVAFMELDLGSIEVVGVVFSSVDYRLRPDSPRSKHLISLIIAASSIGGTWSFHCPGRKIYACFRNAVNVSVIHSNVDRSIKCSAHIKGTFLLEGSVFGQNTPSQFQLTFFRGDIVIRRCHFAGDGEGGRSLSVTLPHATVILQDSSISGQLYFAATTSSQQSQLLQLTISEGCELKGGASIRTARMVLSSVTLVNHFAEFSLVTDRTEDSKVILQSSRPQSFKHSGWLLRSTLTVRNSTLQTKTVPLHLEQSAILFQDSWISIQNTFEALVQSSLRFDNVDLHYSVSVVDIEDGSRVYLQDVRTAPKSQLNVAVQGQVSDSHIMIESSSIHILKLVPIAKRGSFDVSNSTVEVMGSTMSSIWLNGAWRDSYLGLTRSALSSTTCVKSTKYHSISNVVLTFTDNRFNCSSTVFSLHLGSATDELHLLDNEFHGRGYMSLDGHARAVTIRSSSNAKLGDLDFNVYVYMGNASIFFSGATFARITINTFGSKVNFALLNCVIQKTLAVELQAEEAVIATQNVSIGNLLSILHSNVAAESFLWTATDVRVDLLKLQLENYFAICLSYMNIKVGFDVFGSRSTTGTLLVANSTLGRMLKLANLKADSSKSVSLLFHQVTFMELQLDSIRRTGIAFADSIFKTLSVGGVYALPFLQFDNCTVSSSFVLTTSKTSTVDNLIIDSCTFGQGFALTEYPSVKKVFWIGSTRFTSLVDFSLLVNSHVGVFQAQGLHFSSGLAQVRFCGNCVAMLQDWNLPAAQLWWEVPYDYNITAGYGLYIRDSRSNSLHVKDPPHNTIVLHERNFTVSRFSPDWLWKEGSDPSGADPMTKAESTDIYRQVMPRAKDSLDRIKRRMVTEAADFCPDLSELFHKRREEPLTRLSSVTPTQLTPSCSVNNTATRSLQASSSNNTLLSASSSYSQFTKTISTERTTQSRSPTISVEVQLPAGRDSAAVILWSAEEKAVVGLAASSVLVGSMVSAGGGSGSSTGDIQNVLLAVGAVGSHCSSDETVSSTSEASKTVLAPVSFHQEQLPSIPKRFHILLGQLVLFLAFAMVHTCVFLIRFVVEHRKRQKGSSEVLSSSSSGVGTSSNFVKAASRVRYPMVTIVCFHLLLPGFLQSASEISFGSAATAGDRCVFFMFLIPCVGLVYCLRIYIVRFAHYCEFTTIGSMHGYPRFLRRFLFPRGWWTSTFDQRTAMFKTLLNPLYQSVEKHFWYWIVNYGRIFVVAFAGSDVQLSCAVRSGVIIGANTLFVIFLLVLRPLRLGMTYISSICLSIITCILVVVIVSGGSAKPVETLLTLSTVISCMFTITEIVLKRLEMQWTKAEMAAASSTSAVNDETNRSQPLLAM